MLQRLRNFLHCGEGEGEGEGERSTAAARLQGSVVTARSAAFPTTQFPRKYRTKPKSGIHGYT